jgi:hypothetical protein
MTQFGGKTMSLRFSKDELSLYKSNVGEWRSLAKEFFSKRICICFDVSLGDVRSLRWEVS